jgi:hypothetical protein
MLIEAMGQKLSHGAETPLTEKPIPAHQEAPME